MFPVIEFNAEFIWGQEVMVVGGRGYCFIFHQTRLITPGSSCVVSGEDESGSHTPVYFLHLIKSSTSAESAGE